jgi:hypothetical protein
LEEVVARSGHEVLMEVDYNSALMVGNPQRILGQQLKPHPIGQNVLDTYARKRLS